MPAAYPICTAVAMTLAVAVSVPSDVARVDSIGCGR